MLHRWITVSSRLTYSLNAYYSYDLIYRNSLRLDEYNRLCLRFIEP